MLIAQADSDFVALYLVYIAASIVYAIQVFLVYFVIWTRKDWISETRIATSIAVTLGIWIPPVTYVFYSIADVVSRRAVPARVKILWILAIVLLPGLGVLAYFIWALQGSNRPGERRAYSGQRSPASEPAQGVRGSGGDMTSDDLDYLQKLADLHDQGVITDEQYDTQRRQRLGE